MSSSEKISKFESRMDVSLTKINDNVDAIRKDVEEIKDTLKKDYPTRVEMEAAIRPIETKIDGIQKFRTVLEGIGVAVIIGILGLLIAHVIPGFKL